MTPSTASVPPADSRRHTLLITLGFPPARGGIQSCLYERACLAQDEIVVLAPHVPGASAFDARQPFPIHRWQAFMGTLPALPRVVQTLLPLLLARRLLERYPIRVIECGQVLPFAFAGQHIRRTRHIPYRVWTYGDDLLKPARQPLLRAWARRGLEDAAPALAISRFTQGLLHELYGIVDAPIIPPLIDADAFGHIPPSRPASLPAGAGPVLLTVARLVPRKGIAHVLRLLPVLRQSYPDMVYVIVGTGPHRLALERLAGDLGVRGMVHFAGDVALADLPAYYAACDLFVLLSDPDARRGEAEGYGMVYLEAAAAGRPSLGWRTGGVAEALLDGQTGLLAPFGDLPATQTALRRLLADRALALRLGMQGKEWAGACTNTARSALRGLDAAIRD